MTGQSPMARLRASRGRSVGKDGPEEGSGAAVAWVMKTAGQGRHLALPRRLPRPERRKRSAGSFVAHRDEVFGDDVVAAAMIARLFHHAEVVALKGDS